MVTYTPTYTPRLLRLLEVCRNWACNLPLEELLPAIINLACEMTSSPEASILVYDGEAHCLRFIAAPAGSIETMKVIGVPIDRSVAGWVFTQKQTAAMHIADRDDRIYRVVDRELSNQTHSLLAVPMMFRGTTIGVFEAINKLDDARYTQEDILILETLAAQVAIAIQNQRLLQDAQNAYQKTVELDRMKSDFISIVSHELRTPIGVILGQTTLLCESAREDQQHDLDVILQSSQRLKEVVDQLSDSNALETGLYQMHIAPVDLPVLINQVVDTFREMASAKMIRLSVRAAPAGLKVMGDPEKIAIAFSNLLKNALMFTNEGGVVIVRAKRSAGFANISVIDSGIGIPADEQEKIFQRFYQVEKHLTRRHGGMGLGLSIATEMVQKHGGKIWVESVEGKGSKFSFTLPLTGDGMGGSVPPFLI